MLEHIDYGKAERSGYSIPSLHKMWEPIRQAIRLRLIPGASAAVLYRGERMKYAAGLAVDTPEEAIPAELDTIYDCASLTKVTVTLPLLLLLIDQGKLGLDDPVAAYLPAFDRQDKRIITIRHLLSHTAGLAASRDFHSQPWTPERILSSLAEEPLLYVPGTRSVYSDLGFILLGKIAVRLLGIPIDRAAKQYLFHPIGMEDSTYCPAPVQRPRIAATEFSPDIGVCWHGIVHDENARAMGGASGHAGLFSTAGDMVEYARMWLASSGTNLAAGSGQSLLSPETVSQAITTQTPVLPDMNRGLGWVLKGDTADVSGSRFSQRAYGHTGFTGTSLHLDPERDLAVVLLTNRVHYGRGQSITQLRTDFHDAVVATLLGS